MSLTYETVRLGTQFELNPLVVSRHARQDDCHLAWPLESQYIGLLIWQERDDTKIRGMNWVNSLIKTIRMISLKYEKEHLPRRREHKFTLDFSLIMNKVTRRKQLQML